MILTKDAELIGEAIDSAMQKIWNDLPPLNKVQQDALKDVMWEQICYALNIPLSVEDQDGN